jgi:large subunit ribosomal protein L23
MVNNLDTRKLIDLIRRPIITEKATLILENNQYTFEVDAKATKPQIRAAVELMFDVKVAAVNTLKPPRKTRRVGKFMGHRPLYKRAIVTLAPGNSITLFPEL